MNCLVQSCQWPVRYTGERRMRVTKLFLVTRLAVGYVPSGDILTN